MPDLERKVFHPQLKSFDETTGEAKFLFSIYNKIDHSKDRVLTGAFTKSLAARMPKFVADHQWDVAHKLGKVLAISDTPDGPEAHVKFNLEKQLSREVHSDFKFDPEGVEFSFGYIPTVFTKNDEGGRDLAEIDLYEIGPVLIGDQPSTRLTDVKSMRQKADKAALLKKRARLMAEAAVLTKAEDEADEDAMEVTTLKHILVLLGEVNDAIKGMVADEADD
jgi:HK97 family phage prohead protease